MSISIDNGGKGGKKALSADLNLVPYIDLLTCMVAFLLITAVWSQLAQLSVKEKGKGLSADDNLPMAKMVLLVGGEGFNLTVGDDQQALPKKGEAYDFVGLADSLKKAKKSHPDKDDVQIAAEDSVVFEPLAQVMDAVIAAGFPAVSLTDTGAAGL
jgi:biopolymer transport protein TolR